MFAVRGRVLAELVTAQAQFVGLRDDLLRGHLSLASFLRARLHVCQTS